MDKPGQVQDQKDQIKSIQKSNQEKGPILFYKNCQILCNANDRLSFTVDFTKFIQMCVVLFSYIFNAHFDKVWKAQPILFCKVIEINHSYVKALRKGFV